MSRLPAAVFAALVVATSPNADGRRETVAFTFKLKNADDVDLQVVDADGEPVRRLAELRIPAYTPRRFVWDGRDDAGRPVEDGTYRLRITLRNEGRSVLGTQGVVMPPLLLA